MAFSGGSSPLGTISFALYGPSDQTCSGAPLTMSEGEVAGNGSYASASYTATEAGTYHWTASYGGDADNEPAGTECLDGAVVVTSKADSGGSASGGGGTTTGTVTTPSGAATASAPITSLRLIKVARKKAHGTGRARFWVPAAGTLTITGKGVKKASVRVGGAGFAKVRLIPKGAYRTRLLTNHRGFTRIKVTFRPSDGTAVGSQTRRVRLVWRTP